MLTERQKKIMVAIVETYTENLMPEPIGSSLLSKYDGLDVSTATLRNEMATLEELGYLCKPHTSSGRIPTEKGYRLYVDELMNNESLQEELDDQVFNYLEQSKLSKKEASDQLIKSVVDNKDFNYGAVVLEKTAFNSRIKKIDFVYLKKHKAIFLMVTDKGLVLSKEVVIPEGINITSIENTVSYLDEKLHDMLLNDFKQARELHIPDDGFFDYIQNPGAVLELVLRNIQLLVEDKRKIIGQFNILSHSEFSDIEMAQKYLECLKNEEIYQIVDFDNGPLPVIGSKDNLNITVKIGHEHHHDVMNHFSSITAYYQSNESTGCVTIYGPLRMKYRYIVSLLIAILKNMK